MAHAFVWHELDYNNGNITDSTVQLPYVDMGTIRQGSWNKKLFRLKWVNTSVDNVKLWIDSFIADVGVLPDGLSQQDPEDLVKRYGFKYKYLILNQYETKNLPDCIASTFAPLDRDPDTSELRILGSIGIYKPALNDLILLKNQQGVGTTEDNGVYKIYKQKSVSFLGANLTNTVLRAGYGISSNPGIGVSYYLAYSPTKPPLSQISYTVDEVKWVLRNTSDYLDDVKYATSINHTSTGSGSAKSVLLSATEYLGSTASTNVAINDRILVKSQSDSRENGVYKVTSLYAKNLNSFSDPRNSSSTLDAYWTSSTGVTSLIKSGTTFDVSVLNGDTYGGRSFRAYSSLENPDYRDLNWSETTYHNTYTSVTGYLETTDDFTITVGLATTDVLPNSPDWSATTNSFTATGAATTLVIDGVNVTSSSTKILVKNEGSGIGASNGIYALSTIGGTATTWVLTRTSDFDQSFTSVNLSPVYVSSGAINAQNTYYLNTQGPIVLNTTGLNWDLRSFEYTSGGAATIYGLPITISATGGTTYTLQANDTLLIKDLTTIYQPDSYKNGIYSVVSTGSSVVARRTSPYNSGAGISALAIKTILNQNINGGQYFYMNKSDQTADNFTLNLSGIQISDNPIKYQYKPAANIVLNNITSGYGVTILSEKSTEKGILSVNDRVLITNQTDAYKNGIWEVASGPSVKTGLGFTDTYTIQNGALVYVSGGTVGSATTYMLYSAAADGTTPGSNAVKFFDYNAAFTGSGQTTTVALTTVDKLSSTYITPDDFSAAVGNSERVLVNINSTSNNKNGIYSASIGSTLKYAWNFQSAFSQWWNNISKSDSYGFETNFIGQDKSLYYVINFETETKGNIYIPQVITSKKTSLSFDDKQLENYELKWVEQDYQKYYVRAAFACTSVPPSTAATGSNLYKVYSSSGSSSLFDGDNVLVICNELYPTNVSADFGSTTNFASPNNGIYKARVSSAVGYTGNVYFEKHSDWAYSTSFYNASKDLASPYERPTIVRATDGFVAGYGQSIALSKSVFYMQGALKTRISGLYSEGNEGSENFILGSNIYVSYDYNNLHTFPKIAPIQHIIDYNYLNPRNLPIASNFIYNSSDLVYGTTLSFNASAQLASYVSGTGYTVKIGDRVLFDFKNSSYGTFGPASPYEVSGVYHCIAYNGTNSGSSGSPSYIFRKVSYDKMAGHIDYYKDLTNNGTGSSTGGTITFSLQTTKDSRFTWHPSTYPYSFVYYSNDGSNYLVYNGTASLGATSGTLRVAVGSGITSGSAIKVRLQQTQSINTDLTNYNFIAEQILSDRNNVGTATSRNNTNLSSYDVDARFWQQKDTNTGKELTAINNLTGTSLINSTVDYIINSDVIYSGTANSYIYVKRLYSDSSYGGGATTGGTFYPNNYFTSSSDFYVGGWSVESNTNTQWYSTYNPIGSTSLIQTVETLFAGGGGTEKTILILQPTKSGNLTADQQSLYYKNTTPVYRTKYGKNDQYVLQFKGANKKSVTLSYDDTSFPSTLAPKRVRVGSGSTYFLNYDPNLTSRTTAERSWILDSNIVRFNSAAVASTTNIDLNNEVVSTNGVSISAGSIVLIKEQTDNTKNGIYVNSNINYWTMTRATDMDNVSELIPYGLVNVSGYGDYELQLPDSKPYTIWTSGAAGTNLIFKYYTENPSVFASAATTANISISSTSIADIIDGYSPNDQDKILLLGQTSYQAGVGYTEKVLARFNKTFQASLSRVAAGSTSGEFSIRSLRVKQYSGSGSSIVYESYFDPAATTVGVGSVNFIPVTSIFNYAQVDYVSNSNIDLTTDLNSQLAAFDPTPTTLSPNSILLFKDQTLKTQNLIYYAASTNIMLLKRDASLAKTADVNSNLRVKVTRFDEGVSRPGNYGIWYTGTPTLNTTPLYFVKQYSSIKLTDCACATTSNVNLSSPPTTIDGYELDLNDRILVKNQSSTSENGVYYLFNKQANQWKRTFDLNSSYQLVPQLNVYIKSGSTNSGKIFVINLTSKPRTITHTNLYPYVLDTDPIAWTNYNFGELFNSNPANWKDLPNTRAGAADLQSAKINEFGYAESSNIALAIYVPVVSGKLASSNGKVRNQKINVEYDIAKD